MYQTDFSRGDIVELQDGSEVTIHNYHPNITYIVVSSAAKKKPYTISCNLIKQIISHPLSLEIGDLVMDEDGEEGTVLNSSSSCITIKKKDVITSHSIEKKLPKIKQLTIEKSSRGGKREGAGRKATGNPPKQRKAIQLDLDIAAKLPDLRSLSALLEEFRPIAESGQLRSQKLADFYKKLDSLSKILS